MILPVSYCLIWDHYVCHINFIWLWSYSYHLGHWGYVCSHFETAGVFREVYILQLKTDIWWLFYQLLPGLTYWNLKTFRATKNRLLWNFGWVSKCMPIQHFTVGNTNMFWLQNTISDWLFSLTNLSANYFLNNNLVYQTFKKSFSDVIKCLILSKQWSKTPKQSIYLLLP